jgi:hypothetical protein
MPAALERIVSGGQTGVDRGALDAAIACGVPHGGWCPRGRRAEDGRIPARYALVETASPGYAARTERNVLDSDGTLVLCVGKPRNGTALTCRLARRHGKSLLVVDLAPAEDAEPGGPGPDEAARWIAARGIRVLNVAGPRESTHPGVQNLAADYVRRLLARARGGGVRPKGGDRSR